MGRITWQPQDEGRLLGTLGGIETFWIRPTTTTLNLDFAWTGQSWSVGVGKTISAAKGLAEKMLESFANTTGMTLPEDTSEPDLLTETLLDVLRRVTATATPVRLTQTLALEVLDIFRAKVQDIIDAEEEKFGDIEYHAAEQILFTLLDEIKAAAEELK